MKKTIAAFILAAAAATPAFASDGSDVATQAAVQSGYVARSDAMASYAAAPRGNWQGANDARQSEIQSNIDNR